MLGAIRDSVSTLLSMEYNFNELLRFSKKFYQMLIVNSFSKTVKLMTKLKIIFHLSQSNKKA